LPNWDIWLIINEVVVVVVVVVMGLMVKDTRILVVGPPKSWLRVPQKVMPRNPDKLAHAKTPVDPHSFEMATDFPLSPLSTLVNNPTLVRSLFAQAPPPLPFDLFIHICTKSTGTPSPSLGIRRARTIRKRASLPTL